MNDDESLNHYIAFLNDDFFPIFLDEIKKHWKRILRWRGGSFPDDDLHICQTIVR